jgi:hypothetical protein
MYILESGGATAKKGGEIVFKYASGDYFGELALLNTASRAASIIATGETVCQKLPKNAFDIFLSTGPCGDIIRERAKNLELASGSPIGETGLFMRFDPSSSHAAWYMEKYGSVEAWKADSANQGKDVMEAFLVWETEFIAKGKGEMVSPLESEWHTICRVFSDRGSIFKIFQCHRWCRFTSTTSLRVRSPLNFNRPARYLPKRTLRR